MTNHELRIEARAAGAMHYMPVTPCKNGHLVKRYTKTGSCMECGREGQLRHSKRPKARATRARWRSQPQVRAKERAYAIKYSKRYHYGIAWEDYRSRLAAVGGRCEICERKLHDNSDLRSGKRSDAACVDHDHETGQVRGILCNRCNRAIGLLQERREILERAIAYLGRTCSPIIQTG